MDKADWLEVGEEKEFSFRHDKFETSIRHPSEESNGAKARGLKWRFDLGDLLLDIRW